MIFSAFLVQFDIILDKQAVFWYVGIDPKQRERTYFLFVLHTIYSKLINDYLRGFSCPEGEIRCKKIHILKWLCLLFVNSRKKED